MGIRVGRYETIAPIASGGMATVHLARAVGVGGFERLVAIKVMHEHIAEEPEFVAMFLDEARLAARIRHPNVVATIDVQQIGEGLFLVMEFVEGPSLRRALRHLKDQGKFVPLDVTVRIFIDVLAGLHAAHELKGADGALLNLVHRDVSPANILLGADGVVRLTDFGVARAEARLSSTRGGQLKGKIPYMPPEQIMGQTLDRRADVYAAGVVLWESFVGERLFRASNDGELVHRILAGNVSSPRLSREDIPEPVEQVCMRALSQNPDRRYATAAEFAERLEDAAVEGGLRIATSRAVGAFVTALGVHTTTDDLVAKAESGKGVAEGGLGALSDSVPKPTEDYSVASASVPSTADSSPSGGAMPPSLRDASEPHSTSHGTSAAATQTISTARAMAAIRPSNRKPVLIAVAAVALTAVLATVFVLSQRAGSSAAAGGDETAQGQGGAASADTAVTAVDTAAPDEPQPAATSDAPPPPPVTAAPTTSASAAAPIASAAPPPTKPPSTPRPVRPPTGRPSKPGKGDKPSSAAGYRPPGL